MGAEENQEASQSAGETGETENQRKRWWFQHSAPIDRFTGWLVAWTALLFVATIISAGILFITDHTLKETLEETRRAVVASEKSAKATEDSVKLAADTARRQLRAYVAVTGQDLECANCVTKGSTIYPPKGGPDASEINVIMRVKNFGATPAYQVRSCRGTLLVEPNGFPPSDFAYACSGACETCPPATLGPGDEERVTMGLSTEEFKKATFGVNRLFFFGTITFIDTFHQKREVPFCSMMQGDGKTFLREAYGCPEHNAAKDD